MINKIKKKIVVPGDARLCAKCLPPLKVKDGFDVVSKAKLFPPYAHRLGRSTAAGTLLNVSKSY